MNNPRRYGQAAVSYAEFFDRARRGEKVAYLLLNGAVLSPASRAAEREEIIKRVEGMKIICLDPHGMGDKLPYCVHEQERNGLVDDVLRILKGV